MYAVVEICREEDGMPPVPRLPQEAARWPGSKAAAAPLLALVDAPAGSVWPSYGGGWLPTTEGYAGWRMTLPPAPPGHRWMDFYRLPSIERMPPVLRWDPRAGAQDARWGMHRYAFGHNRDPDSRGVGVWRRRSPRRRPAAPTIVDNRIGVSPRTR